MVEISAFRVNNVDEQLEVVLSTSLNETIQSVLLWTQDTYKDYAQALDFSSKLSQTTNTESFTIASSEIGSGGSLNGIYFLEIVDSTTGDECAGCTNTALGIATDFTRFQYCLSDILCDIDTNTHSINKPLSYALTLNLYISGLRNSLQLANYTTAIMFWKNLDRACKASCTECGKLSYLAKKGLGFQTLSNELILY